MFINIHSHQPAGPKEFVLQNLYKDFDQAKMPGYYSAGLHPWYINAATWKIEMEALKTNRVLKNILAIGECGLDKVCKTGFTLQQQVFIAQLLWANEIKKPLIIHCVRAHEDLLLLLKKHHNK
ncbi:MAG TPA: TatD family hydrolase, partial [Ferruginibacter sp.]|nr:TatD family hydrolase [Ferruginibacter sp.]